MSYNEKMKNVADSWLRGKHIGKMSIFCRPLKIYYCVGLTDSYNLAAQVNKVIIMTCSSDIVQLAQMSFFSKSTYRTGQCVMRRSMFYIRSVH